MANEQQDISCEESRESTSSEDNEEYDDLRVVAVIENNETTSAKSSRPDEKCNATRREVLKTCGSERIVVGIKTEVIILNEAPTAATAETSTSSGNNNTRVTKFRDNPRVIELSDDKSKMELRREFKVDVASSELSIGDSCDPRRTTNVDRSADILSRLPPGTILIKQGSTGSATKAGTARTCGREDSDYVHDSSKESTGTNSSESSSTASYTAAAGKVRRMQYRSVRSKKIVEVRRNPVRNKKKKPIDEDFTRPRQRLLAIKRKSSFVIDNNNSTRKRARSVPTPYMNTRSVTRKMYTVGATYQAPTTNDALEWKEWPSHGMHERPIWHPQVGLAYEYNERSFVSLDGLVYREIIEEPVIEVVSVDPNPERMSMSCNGRRNFERMRYYNTAGGSGSSLELVDNSIISSRSGSFVEGNSFRACMHGSFHSVLAYCARVVTPTYNKNVDMKIRGFSRINDDPGNPQSSTKLRVLPDQAGKIPQQDSGRIRVSSLMIPAGISGSQTLTKIPEATIYPSTSNPTDLPKCLVIPRKTIHFTNVRNIQGNILQEVFNRSSKNTLIFLKPTDPPGKTAEKIAAALNSSATKLARSKNNNRDSGTTAELNLTKQLDDNAISDEALMEMSSIYNNLVPTTDDTDINSVKPAKPTSYVTRPVSAILATRIPKKSSTQQPTSVENPNCQTPRAPCPGFRTDNVPVTTREMSNPTRLPYSSQAAEIAKILAEYNEKAAAKNSNTRTACCNNTATADSLDVRAATKTIKTLKHCANPGRTTFLSVVEQPKKIRVKREEDLLDLPNFRGSFNDPNNQPICGQNLRRVSATITSESELRGRNDDSQQAMDLTTAKSRESRGEKNIETSIKTEDSRKWLQDLIEDTAILYCAAAGVQQGDVAEYMNNLDSAQSIQWLGS